MAAWDKDIDKPRPAWEADLDAPAEPAKPQAKPAEKKPKAEAWSPAAIAADPAVQFAVGAADPFLGALQRLGSGGLKPANPLMAAIGLGAAAMKPGVDRAVSGFNELAAEGGAPMGPRIIGNMLSPASLGAGQLAMPASLAGKTALGAGVGAAGGYAAPAESEDAAKKNAMFGLGLGALAPGLIQGAGKVYDYAANKLVRPVADLFTKQGPTNIAQKYIRTIVGEDNLPKVLDRTGNVQPLIPGSKPTVSEAVAGLPEGSPLNTLQGITAKTPGGPSAAFGNRLLEQQGATDAAKAARTVESGVNYGRAFDPIRNPVKGDAQLAAIAENPFFKDAVPAAMKLAEAKKISPNENLTEFLHDVKLGLDRKLKGGIGEEALSAAQYRQIATVKDQLVGWLKTNNPDYEIGRVAHSKASKAIADDLARRDLAGSQPQATNLAGGLNIADQTRPHSPNLLNRTAMAANFLLRKAGRDIEPQVDKALTEIMLDPAKFTQIMSKLPPATRLNVEQMMQRTNMLLVGAQQ